MPLPSRTTREIAPERMDTVIRSVAEAQDAAWATGQILAAMVLSMVEADLRVLVEHNPWLRAQGVEPRPAPERS